MKGLIISFKCTFGGETLTWPCPAAVWPSCVQCSTWRNNLLIWNTYHMDVQLVLMFYNQINWKIVEVYSFNQMKV